MKQGVNPRTLYPGHRERGQKVYGYTLSDVADAIGRKPRTARACKLGDLRATAAFISRYRDAESRKLTEEELSDPLGPLGASYPMWANRYPQLDLWMCPECEHDKAVREASLRRGLCTFHGGSESIFSHDGGHFFMRVANRMTPYHRVIMGPTNGLHVHHVDFNGFNNRRGNLVVIPGDIHFRIHRLANKPLELEKMLGAAPMEF